MIISLVITSAFFLVIALVITFFFLRQNSILRKTNELVANYKKLVKAQDESPQWVFAEQVDETSEQYKRNIHQFSENKHIRWFLYKRLHAVQILLGNSESDKDTNKLIGRFQELYSLQRALDEFSLTEPKSEIEDELEALKATLTGEK